MGKTDGLIEYISDLECNVRVVPSVLAERRNVFKIPVKAVNAS